MGRFDQSDPGRPRFAWSASSMMAHFTGGAISVRLHDDGTNEFQVLVDGTPTGVVATSPQRELYPLASGLTEGEHEVVLYKRTEARLGEVQFVGFVPATGGALVPSPSHHGRRIEFVGDSITAGFGDEGTTPTCPFSPSTENEFLAYGAVTARNLGAEHATIAWSGKMVDGMSQLYERILPARADSRWDVRAWIPDVVVVNLGTNDFTRGDPGQSPFTAAYLALVERLRGFYPSALIVCALGPMLADTYPPGALNLTHARKYVTQVVEGLRSRGDAHVSFVEFPSQDPMTAGCGFHPNLATQRQMASQLTAVIRAQTGW
jgi:lysophospholipase L1-like esterase